MEGFDVLKVLGSGSFGRAMLCRDRRSGEEVVVKEIKCEDAKALAEAKSEADLMAQHEHSNICRYVASFADEPSQKRLRGREGATVLAQTQVGTPYYLSPEIFEGQAYGFKSDVWSLGVLLYEVLALKVPFEARSMAALCRLVTGAKDPKPLPPAYSPQATALVKQLLARDPSRRPSADRVLRTSDYVRSHVQSVLSHTMGGHALNLSRDAVRRDDGLAADRRKRRRRAPRPRRSSRRPKWRGVVSDDDDAAPPPESADDGGDARPPPAARRRGRGSRDECDRRQAEVRRNKEKIHGPPATPTRAPPRPASGLARRREPDPAPRRRRRGGAANRRRAEERRVLFAADYDYPAEPPERPKPAVDADAAAPERGDAPPDTPAAALLTADEVRARKAALERETRERREQALRQFHENNSKAREVARRVRADLERNEAPAGMFKALDGMGAGRQAAAARNRGPPPPPPLARSRDDADVRSTPPKRAQEPGDIAALNAALNAALASPRNGDSD
ncbi:serine/threonine kinase [Aureococcus anophagefferens]|nr:serine/threonine kinase [Aureococcus anophagefferens]